MPSLLPAPVLRYLPKLPADFTRAKLKSLTYWNAIAPSGGTETLVLRIYKYIDGGNGGIVQMTDALTVNNTFASFTTVDVSSVIRNIFWTPDDILAVSRVYSNANTLQAPLIAWDFELVPANAVEGASTKSAATWPPV